MLTKAIPVATASITEEKYRFDNVSPNRYAKNLLQGGELSNSEIREVRSETWRDQSSKEKATRR
jgi:hypothetical protein